MRIKHIHIHKNTSIIHTRFIFRAFSNDLMMNIHDVQNIFKYDICQPVPDEGDQWLHIGITTQPFLTHYQF